MAGVVILWYHRVGINNSCWSLPSTLNTLRKNNGVKLRESRGSPASSLMKTVLESEWSSLIGRDHRDTALCSDWLRSWCCYAIEIQLKVHKALYQAWLGYFLHLTRRPDSWEAMGHSEDSSVDIRLFFSSSLIKVFMVSIASMKTYLVIMILTNQSTVTLRIWTNERSPLC